MTMDARTQLMVIMIDERVNVKRKKLSKWSDLVMEWEVEKDKYDEGC